MKLTSFLAILALCLTVPAEAAKGNGAARQKQKEKEQEKLAERAKRSENRNAVKAFMEGKDKNNDGSLSLDEYLTGEADVEAATAKFGEFNKNGDRYLSRQEIETMLGL